MAYTGPDRRIHRVFVTRNTEYHVRLDTCVGVRDRESGQWLLKHFAKSLPVAGAIKFYESGAMNATPGLPQIGESMYFESSGRDMVTSSIVSVERPRAEVITQYNDAPPRSAGAVPPNAPPRSAGAAPPNAPPRS